MSHGFWRAHRPELLLTGAWGLTQAIGYGLGIRFDKRELATSVQNVDPELLRHHLAQSLWWLHGQPPGYNLFLGVVLKLSGSHWAGTFQAIQLALSLVLVLTAYALGRRLGLGVWPAGVIGFLVAIAPATLAYANLLFYDFPTLVLVTASALLLARFVDEPTTGRGIALFAALAGLVWMRTVFQLPWLLLVLGLVLLARVPLRTTLVALAVPLALVVGVYAKNWALFGTPTTSTWLGMGAARLTLHDVSLADRRSLVDEGKLSRVSLVTPLSALFAYRNAVPPHRRTGIPILDEPLKSDGYRNLNNIAYVEISRKYLHDDWRVLRLRPRKVVLSAKRALELYLRPPTMTGAVKHNTDAIRGWTNTFDLVVYGSTPYANRIGIFTALAYLACGIAGLVLLVRHRWREDATLLFVWLTVVWVTVGANLTEVGENYRFRFVLDPIVVLFLAALVNRLLGFAPAARAARAAAPGQCSDPTASRSRSSSAAGPRG